MLTKSGVGTPENRFWLHHLLSCMSLVTWFKLLELHWPYLKAGMRIPYRIIVKINDMGHVEVDVLKPPANYIFMCLVRHIFVDNRCLVWNVIENSQPSLWKEHLWEAETWFAWWVNSKVLKDQIPEPAQSVVCYFESRQRLSVHLLLHVCFPGLRYSFLVRVIIACMPETVYS